MITPFTIRIIILGIIILFIAGVGALDIQRRRRTSKPGKLMRLLEATVSLILAEVLFIPAYMILLIGRAFNDTSYTTSSFVEFFISIIPVYFIYGYVIFTVIIAFLIRKYAKVHTAVLTIFILAHVAISVWQVFMYMDAYMTDDINSKYNPIVIHHEKKILEEKQALAKQQEQDYQDYMAKKEAYEIIFERDLDDVQYKITKNNSIFYFEYKNKKNNDAFVKELTTSDDLAEITPEQQTGLYGSDYKMYFGSYEPTEPTEGNFTGDVDYISIPSLGFYYSFDKYRYVYVYNEREYDLAHERAYKRSYERTYERNKIVVNNELTHFNEFLHELFLEEIKDD